MNTRVTGACAAALLCSSSALAGLIDFEQFDVGAIPGETLVVVSDGVTVTFTGPGLTIRQFDNPFPMSKVLSSSGDAGPITVTFDGGLANFIEIENLINGTYTGEVDIIDATAFDGEGNILDFESNADTILRLDGPGIASAVYLEHDQGAGFVMDNFYFEIPAPAAWTLLLAGALGARRRRRS